MFIDLVKPVKVDNNELSLLLKMDNDGLIDLHELTKSINTKIENMHLQKIYDEIFENKIFIDIEIINDLIDVIYDCFNQNLCKEDTIDYLNKNYHKIYDDKIINFLSKQICSVFKD